MIHIENTQYKHPQNEIVYNWRYLAGDYDHYKSSEQMNHGDLDMDMSIDNHESLSDMFCDDIYNNIDDSNNSDNGDNNNDTDVANYNENDKENLDKIYHNSSNKEFINLTDIKYDYHRKDRDKNISQKHILYDSNSNVKANNNKTKLQTDSDDLNKLIHGLSKLHIDSIKTSSKSKTTTKRKRTTKHKNVHPFTKFTNIMKPNSISVIRKRRSTCKANYKSVGHTVKTKKKINVSLK